MSVYDEILKAKSEGRKMLAVLLDPEKTADMERVARYILSSDADMVFVGGSGYNVPIDDFVARLRQLLVVSNRPLPIVLFPGDICQFSPKADALLFLSLISGRNADMLIGRHVKAAKAVRESGIETIPMGYILVDGGKQSTVERVTGTTPLLSLDDILSTALAGEMLGHKLIYLEAGSGADMPVKPSVISTVSSSISVPLIVGGGICNVEQLLSVARAGADLLVVGNHFETHPEDIPLFASAMKHLKIKS